MKKILFVLLTVLALNFSTVSAEKVFVCKTNDVYWYLYDTSIMETDDDKIICTGNVYSQGESFDHNMVFVEDNGNTIIISDMLGSYKITPGSSGWAMYHMCLNYLGKE